MPNNYTPRRGTPVHSSSTRRAPMRDTSYTRDRYIPRSSKNSRRKRRSGPPPILYLAILVLVILIVVIALIVKGCSSKPEDTGSTNSSSQVSSGLSDGSSLASNSSDASGSQTSSQTSEVSEQPTPAPQSEPQADPETIGALLVVGDTAYEYYNFNTDLANSYITAVSDAGKKLSGTSTLYDMVVPTSIDIMLPESYISKNNLNTSDQRKTIEEYLYPSIQAMNPDVKTVSTFDTLKSHANEYLYFRTDHHWTQLGAYYAYTEFCKVRGFDPVPLTDFDKKEYTGYLGSFYSSSSDAAAKLGGNPDTVEAYVPKANVTLNATQQDGQVLENWPLVADGDQYGESMKYLIYAAGDQPYEEITNNDKSDGSACILVKESFGNCFIPFLVNHYNKVYVVDYRYYTNGTVTQLAQQTGATDVLCLNNISMTRNEDLINRFTNIF